MMQVLWMTAKILLCYGDVMGWEYQRRYAMLVLYLVSAEDL